jgi:hypothetical protein
LPPPGSPGEIKSHAAAGAHLAVDRAGDMFSAREYSPSPRIHGITALMKMICDALEK